MSADKIIQQIKKDSQSEIKQIQKQVEKQIKEITSQAREQAKTEAEKILEHGKKQSLNHKKILVSQANQEAKKQLMNAREKIIEECFLKAHHELSTLTEDKYKKIVTKLMQNGKTKIGEKCLVQISHDIDRKIAEELGLQVMGRVESCGGVILKSVDGKIILDCTFDGIIKREKDKIRIKVGKLLFSENMEIK